MLDVISRPVVEESVEGSDMVKDHLISRISKLLADLIVDDVLEASLVQT